MRRLDDAIYYFVFLFTKRGKEKKNYMLTTDKKYMLVTTLQSIHSLMQTHKHQIKNILNNMNTIKREVIVVITKVTKNNNYDQSSF